MDKIEKKLRAVKKVYRLYGAKGVVKGSLNKMLGRRLDTGLEARAMSHDDRGKVLFKEQQSELSFEKQKMIISKMEYTPKVSVIMPIYNAQLKWLKKAVESLKNQSYENWELCAANDGSTDREAYEYLVELQKNDDRIKLYDAKENKGISAASNQAFKLADGDYIALMDQDDEITLDAFFWFIKLINENRDADFIYSDECKIDGKTGTELSYFICKPDWSPEMMINQMYTGHLTLYRRILVEKLGGFRSEYDFSQDYDLALRASRETNAIYHVERILYFWRSVATSSAAGGKDFARESNLAALKDYLEKEGIEAEMLANPYGNYARFKQTYTPKISIVVPSDSCENMIRTVNGILDKTDYDDYEIILVTNSNAITELKTQIEDSRVIYCKYDKEFNFSLKCNEGADCATGDVLIFYNDDVIPKVNDWIERMIELFQIDGVGGISPMLVYEDDKIQYAGMISGVRGQVGTSFHFKKYKQVDYWFNQNLIRNVSVLSGACAVIKKEVFDKIGKFDWINTPSGHSDVDISYKLIENGYRCVYTPYAVMTHIGNHSWAKKDVKDKCSIFCYKRWGKYIERDPYFTESMKRLFYYPSVFNFYIYSPDTDKYKENIECKDILFVTHELTRTGAPVQLLNMIKATIDELNYFPTIVSPVDGPMKEDFLNMGATVLIDQELAITAENMDEYARNYDLIVVNTMAEPCIRVVNELKDTIPNILWWIHEGTYAFGLFKKWLDKSLNKKATIYCASEYSQEILDEYSEEYKSKILRCGVEDFVASDDTSSVSDDFVRFITVGTVEWRKGQDLLLDAAKLLDAELLKKIKIHIVGTIADKEIFSKIEKFKSKYGCFEISGNMPRNELIECYKKSDCAVIPSRDEPTSLIGIENMVLSKPIITSTKTGISNFVEDGKNGFVFESDNAEQLAEKIRYIVEHRDQMKKIGEQARKTYEETYSMDIFSKNCLNAIKSLMD